jgi:hypothetical protein
VLALALLLPAAAAAAEPLELRVMTFNVWYGGDEVDFGKTVEAIEASGADVVGLQEPYASEERIAAALGWEYVDTRLHVISRFPILAPEGSAGLYGLVEVRPGEVVAIANTHLPAEPYGPYLARDGAWLAKILKLETSYRMPYLRPHLVALGRLLGEGIPVFFTGDFNSPSHLDWTAAVARARPEVPFPVAWPESIALAQLGFRDSYREAHPDPLAAPGHTWTPGYPAPKVDEGEVHDRIDFVYAAGDATVLDSRILGEPGSELVDVPIDPWPSDHRAVVSTFRVVPAPVPVVVAASPRLLTVGGTLRVTFHGDGDPGGTVALVDRASRRTVLERPTGGALDGTFELPTAGLRPGALAVQLRDGSGAVVTEVRVRLAAPDEQPSVSTDKRTYAAGEPIRVSWARGPGNRYDWLGLYRDGEDPETTGILLGWRYVGASFAGTLVMDARARNAVWPLPPGRYRIYLFPDDDYTPLAGSAFRVR